jgi:hypothetical protein
MDTNLEYIKHNKVKFEGSKRGYENFKEFFENIKRTVKEVKGYTILENMEDD